jgi:diguanylate cyclase (GGDEF)-like protein
VAFLFLDLDHFKEINDSFGHGAGDDLLRQLGPRLTSTLRGTDILVRLGGDEFAVVLIDADATYAMSVAERLMASLKEPFALDVMNAKVGASIGIALGPHHGSDATGLLRCADVAMYRAKLERVSIEVYNPQLDDEGNWLRIAEELRVAVEERQFVLHYQPQLDLSTGEILGVEALLRWPHPRLGPVPPLKFLPVAEDAGLMPSLTALVLDTALAQCAAWRADGHLISVAVNVSPSNLLEAGFTELITEALDRYLLPAAALVLEITETCIITDFERSRTVIEELRDLGLIVSIDDFGAGFTSLAYLRDLAVGELKLDRTFVSGLVSPDKARDLSLVKSTIDLGHALGLRVVAEGVEDLETLDVLGRLGCDLAQGFYIAMPAPAEDVVFTSDVAKLAEAVLDTRAAIPAGN